MERELRKSELQQQQQLSPNPTSCHSRAPKRVRDDHKSRTNHFSFTHAQKMTKTNVFVVLLGLVVLAAVADAGELAIGVKKRPETCDVRTKAGDRLSMHYTVSTRVHAFLHVMLF